MTTSRDSAFARMISQMQKAFAHDADMPCPVQKKASKTERRYLQLKVSLKDISPPIWRRFVVPNDFTLEQLHDCLQIIMGWEDSHMYEFIVGGRRGGRSFVGSPFGDVDVDDLGAEDPADYNLGFLTKKGMKFTYIYDMGDSWDHEIVVENADYDHPSDEPPVVVLKGKRNCPPEDCGGSWGYTELVEALADKEHPQHEDMMEWISEYDPEEFNMEECNAALISRFGLPQLRKKVAKKAVKKAAKKAGGKE